MTTMPTTMSMIMMIAMAAMLLLVGVQVHAHVQVMVAMMMTPPTALREAGRGPHISASPVPDSRFQCVRRRPAGRRGAG
jgi:hypothetical protein